jgi:hypothetical protein
MEHNALVPEHVHELSARVAVLRKIPVLGLTLDQQTLV